MAKKKQSEVPRGVLRLKLGSCLNYRTRRFLADMQDIAQRMNQARNAMSRAWQRWHEDHPEAYDAHFPARAACPYHQTDKTKEVDLSTYLYQVGRISQPFIYSTIMASLSKRLAERLRDDEMPYNHQGHERMRWRAVLCNEVNLDTAREWVIPWPVSASGIGFVEDQLHSPDGKQVPLVWVKDPKRVGIVENLTRMCHSAAVVAIPLWSGEAGRSENYAYVRYNTSNIGNGNRRRLRNLLRGEPGWEISDSQIVYKECNPNSYRSRHDRVDGNWYLHLSYTFPVGDLLDPEREARLWVNPDHTANSPFLINCKDHLSGWRIGHGNVVRESFQRLNSRRRNMRSDYAVTGTGRRGHGRGRFFRPIEPVTRSIQFLVSNLANLCAGEIGKYCERNNCGTLRYIEPRVGAERDQSWFACPGDPTRKIQWDWTLFYNRLESQCRKRGIRLLVGEPEGGGSPPRRPPGKPPKKPRVTKAVKDGSKPKKSKKATTPVSV